MAEDDCGTTSPDGQPNRADESSRGPLLVPRAVTQAKFEEQLRRFDANRDAYARRGWVLLGADDLSVEVGFLQRIPMASMVLPVMTTCVRIDYWNFDLWPPSVTFLDPLSREPVPPLVRAPDNVSEFEVRDALIDVHPDTGLPFLCLPGIREYHSHPQHNGDDWLLHRNLHEGDLAVLCDRIWRRMARNVIGIDLSLQMLPIGTRLDVALRQFDPDEMQRQIQMQMAAGMMPGAPPSPGPGGATALPLDVAEVAEVARDSADEVGISS